MGVRYRGSLAAQRRQGIDFGGTARGHLIPLLLDWWATQLRKNAGKPQGRMMVGGANRKSKIGRERRI
jgi:hypothetical protein